MKLEGKVAIVTGSTSGMGRATAKLFAEEGAKVVVTGRNEERAKACVDDIKAAGVEVITPTPEAFEGFKGADTPYRDSKIAEWGVDAIFAEAMDYVANNTK